MAVTVSFGKCAGCNENNAMTNSVCRKCNADLPWSKKKKAAVKTASAPAKVRNVPAKTRSMPEIDFGLWFMAGISFFIPLIGYLVWRSYAENGDNKSTAVGWASILGFLFFILRVVAKVSMRHAT